MAKRVSSAKVKEPAPTRAAATKPAKATQPAKSAEASPAAPVKSERKTAAQAVRDFMQSHPHLRNRDIVQALAVQGIVIDDTIPAQIKSRDNKGRPAKPTSTKATAVTAELSAGKTRQSESKTAAEKSVTVRMKAMTQPTIFVHSPVHAKFAHDLLAVRTHSQAVKNLRILVTRLERIIDMLEVLKDDDWDITLLAQPDGLLFSATHEQASNTPQVRARLEKLSIQPNEVVIVEPPAV